MGVLSEFAAEQKGDALKELVALSTIPGRRLRQSAGYPWTAVMIYRQAVLATATPPNDWRNESRLVAMLSFAAISSTS